MRALDAVNQRFYSRHAGEFSDTRETPWRGWERVLANLAAARDEGRELRVLDLRCGNGRFALYLAAQWRREGDGPRPWAYLGLDASQALLDRATARLAAWPGCELAAWNLVEDHLEAAAGERSFSLVALFGLLHHVPGAELRRQLLLEAAARLEPGGFLALSLWRFAAEARFSRRILPWEEAGEELADVDRAELEPGDHLLRWGAGPGAVRYCHATTSEEVEAWRRALGAEPSGLELAGEFLADGRSGALNHYLLFRRAARR